MLKYAVLYQSDTGNTRRLAAEIFSVLPGKEKDIVDLKEEKRIPEAENYFVGFSVRSGTCDMRVIDCLGGFHGKRIALFATCGASPVSEYRNRIERNVSVWIDEDNIYAGMYLCQGKMPMPVREKYAEMQAEYREQAVRLLQNFDEALLHPDKTDIQRAREFALSIAEMVE